MEENVKRTRTAAVRFTAAEFALLQQRCKATTCRQMSEYIRKCLLDKPLTTRCRNVSLDDFMLELIALRRELSAVGSNFNQSVKKLHALRQIPEFQFWLLSTQNQYKELLDSVAAIENWIEKTARKWLQ